MVTAILVIDMIKDFVTGKFENDRAKNIVPNIKKLVESAREQNKPVIYATDSHPEGDHEFEIWGQHAVSGTEGSEIISELEPQEGDYRIKKQKYSAFYETDLDSLLNELEVDEVVLSGVLAHICIQHTAADAFYRGYEITVPKECVDDVTDEANQRAIEFIEENYRASVIELNELMKEW